MTEEQVTKAFLEKLIKNNWEIICYDFPQSGTGKLLHPNKEFDEVGNKIPSINPDIIAFKNGLCLFFENKNRFYYDDFKKVHSLIVNNQYTKSISSILGERAVSQCCFGIGLPEKAYSTKAVEKAEMVDFVFGVKENKDVIDLFNPKKIVL